MLSVLVTVRNASELASNCLLSLVSTFQAISQPGSVEFILVDDASEPQYQVPELLVDFRNRMPGAPTKIVRFKQRQHYTAGLAMGFSLAQGQQILFVSHDMICPPAYVRALLQVAALDDKIGLVRGTSTFVDCFPKHVVRPSLPLRTYNDVAAFADFVSAYWGLHYVEDEFLTGDSFLLKRSVLEKIGVLDTRYFGYFGDVDYGLRIQKAGFKMVCAKGAWLFHEGAGYYKNESAAKQQDYDVIHRARLEVVQQQYAKFRDKWDPSMPPVYRNIDEINWAQIRARGPVDGNLYHPPVTFNPSYAEML